VPGAPPNDSSLADLGQHRLRDVAEMEHAFQLPHPGAALRFSTIYHVLSKPGVRIRYISILDQ